MKDQKRGNGVGLFWICFLCAAVIVAAAVLTIWGADGLLSGLSGNEAEEPLQKVPTEGPGKRP